MLSVLGSREKTLRDITAFSKPTSGLVERRKIQRTLYPTVPRAVHVPKSYLSKTQNINPNSKKCCELYRYGALTLACLGE